MVNMEDFDVHAIIIIETEGLNLKFVYIKYLYTAFLVVGHIDIYTASFWIVGHLDISNN